MGSPDLPPDPYLALGVSRDATAATIKTQYRKLVLKFHPDKVQDETQKSVAADEFHKVQIAYELIGDDDKRARYDAQCKLAELRKDVMDRHSQARDRAPDLRANGSNTTPMGGSRPSPSYYARPPDRSGRVSPMYEERRPSYAPRDYFDVPRPTSRKTADYERTSKRAAPRDEREKSKSSAKEAKKSERAVREERSKKATKELRRERDRRTSHIDEQHLSDSDEYDRATRRMHDEDELRRAREMHYDQARKQRDEAASGIYDGDERAKKLFSQYDDARQYIGRSNRRPDSERRPSPLRRLSSRDKVAYVRGKDGRPAMVRRESNRPKTTSWEPDPRKNFGRDGEPRRPSLDVRNATMSSGDEQRNERRPPTLNQSKSSPLDIRPLPHDKQRSQSMQMEREDAPPPQIRRSETMPNSPSASRERETRRSRDTTAPPKSSHLRQTEFSTGFATPATTPEQSIPSAPSGKYRYGQEYADDAEYPTPEGYRTEVREPVSSTKHAKYTRSSSPEQKERGRDRSDREKTPRIPSMRYAPESFRPSLPGRTTTSTSYVYTPQGVEAADGRPNISRENSGRGEPMLFGEVRGTRSPKIGHKPSPSVSGVRYQTHAQVRPDDVKPQSGHGYSRRPSEAKPPTYTRNSSNPVYVK